MSTFIGTPKHIAYYLNLHKPGVISRLRYRFKDKCIVYGIRCLVTGQLYIGSTMTPTLRFHNHLVTGNHSNPGLQAAIQEHGLEQFAVYVFQVVNMQGLKYAERKVSLTKVEQSYIDMFPDKQLYNIINSSKA